MFSWLAKFINWIQGEKTLTQVLNPEKIVRVHGLKIKIRKLNPLDYATGAQSLLKLHDTFRIDPKIDSNVIDPRHVEQLKSHYRDVLMSGVIGVYCHGKWLLPTREKEVNLLSGKICVDNLFTDWDLAEKLYSEILAFTYGKKKLKSPAILKPALSK